MNPASIMEPSRIAASVPEVDQLTLDHDADTHSFIDAVRTTLRSGPPSVEAEARLQELRSFYCILEEEHRTILRRVKRELGLPDDDASIIVVDDDRTMRLYLQHVLRRSYKSVVAMANTEDVIPWLGGGNRPDVIICDVNLGNGAQSGISFLQKLREGKYGSAAKDIVVILMSATGEAIIRRTAEQFGAWFYLEKPFSREILDRTILMTMNRSSSF